MVSSSKKLENKQIFLKKEKLLLIFWYFEVVKNTVF